MLSLYRLSSKRNMWLMMSSMEPVTFVLESGRLTAKLEQRSTFSCINIGVHVGEAATHAVSTRANYSRFELASQREQIPKRSINWGLPDFKSDLDILVLVVDARAFFVHVKQRFNLR